MDKNIERLREWVDSAHAIVFFGGAGVSTESGIPDFRGSNGLYTQKGRLSPEEIISHHFFMSDPGTFYDFYRQKMVYPDAKPNSAHIKLAGWEKEGRLLAVVTQNIDGLHTLAGSHRIYELHGSIHRNTCMKCGRSFPLTAITDCSSVPKCDCGGIIKPDVVLYEEGLDEETLSGAINAIRKCDLLIVAGTSLTVWPAAGLISYAKTDRICLINRDATGMDSEASLVIHDSLGKVFAAL